MIWLGLNGNLNFVVSSFNMKAEKRYTEWQMFEPNRTNNKKDTNIWNIHR